MGSSGGGSGNPALLMQNASPMPGLPVAGSDNATGDPYEYGRFQNFLPDIPAEGRAPSAEGLRPDMFQYKSPKGVIDPQVQGLRDELAKLKSTGTAASDGSGSYTPKYLPGGGLDPNDPGNISQYYKLMNGGSAPNQFGAAQDTNKASTHLVSNNGDPP